MEKLNPADLRRRVACPSELRAKAIAQDVEAQKGLS